MQNKKITLIDVKNALKDERFRKALPESLQAGADKFVKDPGCSCNHRFIKEVLKQASEQLLSYYPTANAVSDIEEETKNLAKNNWRVINCSIDELASELQKLPTGRKQIDVARWENQVTVIINELEFVF